ncbi:clostripain-related cysteine peptidase [Bacillus paranthracis]|uniref:clostripain-related cysteine peptidase n=1 Tax=Bacillus paranthracis TaxID=2026186 RepID=UPI003EE2BA67
MKKMYRILLIIMFLIGFSSLVEDNVIKVSADTNKLNKAKYTVMVYLDGSSLESDFELASEDLKEMLKIGSSEEVNIIMETGGAKKWHTPAINPETNQRWIIQKDSLQFIEDVGLKNMGESSTLSDFMIWGMEKYPAEKYAVILWGHGSGSVYGYGHDERFGLDPLTLPELEKTFKDTYEKTRKKLEIVAFDACLVTNLETLSYLNQYANYIVGSEDMVPGHGLNYIYTFERLLNKPNMNGAELGRIIADGFYKQAVENEEDDDIAMSVIDLSKVKPIKKAFDDIARLLKVDVLNNDKFQSILTARRNVEEYGKMDGPEDSEMVDLGDLAKQMYSQYPFYSRRIMSAVDQAVVYNVKSPWKQATGICLFFPLGDRERFDEKLNLYKNNNFSKDYYDFLEIFIGNLKNNQFMNVSDEPLNTNTVKSF